MKRMQSTETLGLHLGDQLGQDRHADPEPDDRRRRWRSVGRRYAIDGPGLLDRGQHHPCGRAARHPLDEFLLPMVLASDAVLSRRRADRRPHRGRAGRAGGQGRRRRRRDPAGVPADRRAALRRRLQTDGHVPPDDRRTGTTWSAASSRAPPTSCSPAPRRSSTPTTGPCRPTATFRRAVSGREPAARRAGPAGAGHRPQGLRPGRLRSRRRPAAAGSGLELLALVGIVDPPRPAAKASIATAKAAGIRVRMITGDHAVTAAAIAGQLGIDGK